ncbi:hypothetical protein HanIR_Chr10g0500181 [Helianthus annuus]|nr:hypothetical protein HanIR_Chr10g0500181 [Helianthus annuus]
MEKKMVSDCELWFSAGIASDSFPIRNFEMCPQCGCGMDCDGVVGSDRGEGVDGLMLMMVDGLWCRWL